MQLQINFNGGFEQAAWSPCRHRPCFLRRVKMSLPKVPISSHSARGPNATLTETAHDEHERVVWTHGAWFLRCRVACTPIRPHEFYCCRTCGCPSERSLPLDNAKSTLFGLMQQAQCTEYLDTPVCHLGPVCPANLFGEIFPDANEKEINLENKSTNIVIKMS